MQTPTDRPSQFQIILGYTFNISFHVDHIQISESLTIKEKHQYVKHREIKSSNSTRRQYRRISYSTNSFTEQESVCRSAGKSLCTRCSRNTYPIHEGDWVTNRSLAVLAGRPPNVENCPYCFAAFGRFKRLLIAHLSY